MTQNEGWVDFGGYGTYSLGLRTNTSTCNFLYTNPFVSELIFLTLYHKVPFYKKKAGIKFGLDCTEHAGIKDQNKHVSNFKKITCVQVYESLKNCTTSSIL